MQTTTDSLWTLTCPTTIPETPQLSTEILLPHPITLYPHNTKTETHSQQAGYSKCSSKRCRNIIPLLHISHSHNTCLKTPHHLSKASHNSNNNLNLYQPPPPQHRWTPVSSPPHLSANNHRNNSSNSRITTLESPHLVPQRLPRRPSPLPRCIPTASPKLALSRALVRS